MAENAPAGRARFWTAGPALVIALACGLVLLTHRTLGPVFIPDSQSFVVLADQIRGHGTYDFPFVEATLRSLTNGGRTNPPPWPPGFPALTALTGAVLHVSSWSAAQWLSVLAALASVLLAAALCRRLGGTAWTAALAAVAFAVSPATLAMVPFVLSEQLFVVLVLAALIVCLAGDDLRARQMLAVGLLALAACLVRYAGVGLVLTLAGAIALRRQQSLPARARAVLLVAGLPAVGIAGWMVRNRLVTGYLDDYRGVGGSSLTETLSQPPKTLIMMFVGLQPHKLPLALLLAAALVTLLVAVVRAWPSLRRDASARNLATTFAFCLVYTAWLCFARWRSNLSPIDTRYLWPMWPALLAAGAALVQRLVAHVPARKPVVVASAAVMLVLLGGGVLTARQYARVDLPQTLAEGERRERLATLPVVQQLALGKQVLVVDYWTDPIRRLTPVATRVWYMSPYAFRVRGLSATPPWPTWLDRLDLILSPEPVPLDPAMWSALEVPGAGMAYSHR